MNPPDAYGWSIETRCPMADGIRIEHEWIKLRAGQIKCDGSRAGSPRDRARMDKKTPETDMAQRAPLQHTEGSNVRYLRMPRAQARHHCESLWPHAYHEAGSRPLRSRIPSNGHAVASQGSTRRHPASTRGSSPPPMQPEIKPRPSSRAVYRARIAWHIHGPALETTARFQSNMEYLFQIPILATVYCPRSDTPMLQPEHPGISRLASRPPQQPSMTRVARHLALVRATERKLLLDMSRLPATDLPPHGLFSSRP